MTLRQSKTTHDLLTHLSKFKSQKQEIANRLTEDISRNKQLIEEPIYYNGNYKQKTMMKRFRSIDALEKKLNHKKEADDQQQVRLESEAYNNQKRRAQLERRLQQLAKRNQNRIQELKNLEENVIAKINSDIKRNEMRQRHLKEEYQRLKKQEKNIKEVNIFQKNESKKQWKVLQAEKWKIQMQARDKVAKQQALITQKNPKPVKKEDKKRQLDKYIPTEKQYNRLRNPTKIDPKQVGRQYLQQAKLAHREVVADRKKKKLMNLNLKVIDYNPDIIQLIFRNTSDLSKQQPRNLENSQRNSIKNCPESQHKQPEMQLSCHSSRGYEIGQDLQTQRYLEKVKNNIDQLQKMSNPRNPEQAALSEGSDKLLAPITIELKRGES